MTSEIQKQRNELIATQQALDSALQTNQAMGKRLLAMRDALQRIATHKHINPDGSLNAAVAYSASIAMDALKGEYEQ